jgi:hypothetical protein
MSTAHLTICLYLQDGTRSSTLHSQGTDTRKDVIQLAIWLANATIGTAVVQTSGEATIHVARHPKATRPPDTKVPGLRRGADRISNPLAVRFAAGPSGEAVTAVGVT